jgi:hypothetical protein
MQLQNRCPIYDIKNILNWINDISKLAFEWDDNTIHTNGQDKMLDQSHTKTSSVNNSTPAGPPMH